MRVNACNSRTLAPSINVERTQTLRSLVDHSAMLREELLKIIRQDIKSQKIESDNAAKLAAWEEACRAAEAAGTPVPARPLLRTDDEDSDFFATEEQRRKHSALVQSTLRGLLASVVQPARKVLSGGSIYVRKLPGGSLDLVRATFRAGRKQSYLFRVDMPLASRLGFALLRCCRCSRPRKRPLQFATRDALVLAARGRRVRWPATGAAEARRPQER